MGWAGPQRRRARLVADGGGLENRYGGNLIVGSNPTPSAIVMSQDIGNP